MLLINKDGFWVAAAAVAAVVVVVVGIVIEKIYFTLLRVFHTSDRFGLVSLFNGISTFYRLFNAKAIPLEEQ